MKLTKAAIDALQYRPEKGAKDIHWDVELRGFGLRVWPSGKKVFVLSYRAAGRKRLITIGQYGFLTLVQARDEAKKRMAEVISGDDPMLEREKERRGTTLGDLCDAYLERHSRQRKASARDDERVIAQVLKPKLGAFRIEAIRREDIARLHDKLGKERPTTANRMLSLISSMFNKAKLWGYLEDAFPNPAKGIERFPEGRRERFVTRDEMPKLIAEIDKVPNVQVRVALWTYLLTGQRKNEILSLKWSNFDPIRQTLYIEKTKAGRPHLIAISDFHVQLLRSLPRLVGNPYIFFGRKPGSHMVELRYYWDDVRKNSGLTDIRLHDLRHTLASWLVSSGASLALVGRVLGHSQPRTTQRYAHFELAPVAKVLDEHMRALRQLPHDAEVLDVEGT